MGGTFRLGAWVRLEFLVLKSESHFREIDQAVC